MNRTIQPEVENLPSEAILDGDVQVGERVNLRVDKNGESLRTAVRKEKV